MKRIAALFTVLAGAFALSGCGFQPIYATRDSASPVNSQIQLEQVIAPDNVASIIEDALRARIVSADGAVPRYRLYVQASERAERLAVQIDATVTRYNYRLLARYWVQDAETGETVRGTAQAVTSYNIVNSQYSTLFAERTAVDKAARGLAEKIERDILVRFARPEKERGGVDAETFENALDEEDNPLNRQRRDKTPTATIPEELYFLTPDADNATEDATGSVDAADTDPNAADADAAPDVPDPVSE